MIQVRCSLLFVQIKHLHHTQLRLSASCHFHFPFWKKWYFSPRFLMYNKKCASVQYHKVCTSGRRTWYLSFLYIWVHLNFFCLIVEGAWLHPFHTHSTRFCFGHTYVIKFAVQVAWHITYKHLSYFSYRPISGCAVLFKTKISWVCTCQTL